ncbi:hypothetical protein ACOMHN_055150 [Nucella lapillus]
MYVGPLIEEDQLLYTCRNCGARYKHAATMTRHRRKCEGRYNISCFVCGKSFYRLDNYKVHLLRNHGVSSDPRQKNK